MFGESIARYPSARCLVSSDIHTSLVSQLLVSRGTEEQQVFGL